MKTQYVLLALIAISQTFSPDADARRARSRITPGYCGPNVASSTVYFVPHIKDYCKGGQICAKFRSEVRMQGSGTMYGDKVLRYTGRTESARGCPTARGARGTCLQPFISVAADRRYYRMGDIIEMPAMKGRKIDLPDGRQIVHPGYFIVEDTGGAIKGPGRFDFFTGSFNPRSPLNDFGMRTSSGFSLADKNQCMASKKFSVIRRSSPRAEIALASIDNALSTGVDRRLASLSTPNGQM